MGLVDIFIWTVLLLFMIKGFMKGLVREICSFLGLLVGGWGALHYCRAAASAMHAHVHVSPALLTVVSFVLIFLILGLLFFFLGHLLTALFKLILFGSVNRIGGLFLGSVQGALVVSIVLHLGTSGPVPVRIKTTLEGARTAQPFLAGGRILFAGWSSFAPGQTQVRPR